MKTLLIVAGAIATLLIVAFVVVLLIGRSLPVRHHVVREARIPAEPSAVFAAITDVARFPSWRSGISSVEPLPSQGGLRRWRERSGGDAVLYEATHESPPAELVTRIADPSLPFGGSWAYDLRPDGVGGTTIRITENGEVYNPVFRFVSRYVMGHAKTVETYLDDLSRHFAQSGSSARRQ